MAAVLLLLIFLCACQKQETRPETAETTEREELTIGVDMLKPFFYKNGNGDYVGIDEEIAAEACQRAGYQPAFTMITWSERDRYLQEKKVDCLWSAFIKDGREEDYLWTDAYLQSNLRVIVDKNSPDQDVSSIRGHGGLAVRAGSKIEEILLNLPEKGKDSLPIYSCGTFEMAETAFVKGYAGALGGHEAVLLNIINSYPESYRFLDDILMTADLGVAFRKDDTSGKCEKINEALCEMKEDGTISAIYEKYNSGAAEDEEDTFYEKN